MKLTDKEHDKISNEIEICLKALAEIRETMELCVVFQDEALMRSFMDSADSFRETVVDWIMLRHNLPAEKRPSSLSFRSSTVVTPNHEDFYDSQLREANALRDECQVEYMVHRSNVVRLAQRRAFPAMKISAKEIARNQKIQKEIMEGFFTPDPAKPAAAVKPTAEDLSG